MRRVDRERHQHREDLRRRRSRRARSRSASLEVVPASRCGCRPSSRAGLTSSLERARRGAPAARAPSSLMSASTSSGARPTLVGHGEPGGDAALQAGDAHHEELVEVASRRSPGSWRARAAGSVGSSASSSTRWLKASQLSSRSRNRSAGSGAVIDENRLGLVVVEVRSPPVDGVASSGLSVSIALILPPGATEDEVRVNGRLRDRASAGRRPRTR